MKYFSVRKLKQLDPSIELPLGADQADQLSLKLNASSEWMSIDQLSKAYFIESIQHEKQLLFATWTEENKALLEVLESGTVQSVYVDRVALTSHQLFEEYQAFIRFFLTPILSENCINLDFKKVQQIMSFTVLLGKTDQDKIQERIALFFGQLQDELQQSIKKVSSDQQLFETLKQVLTGEFWQTINLFNERYYRVRTNFLEFLLSLAYHKHSSRRLMVFIIAELKQLQLTNEHLKELLQVEKDLKSGKYVFESTKVPWKRLIALSVAALFLVLLGVGIWFIPNHPEEDQLQEQQACHQDQDLVTDRFALAKVAHEIHR